MEHHNGAEEREISRVILELSKRQALLNSEESSLSDKIEKAHRIGQAFYAFAATIAAVAVWVTWMQFTINALQSQVDINSTLLSTQGRSIIQMQNQIDRANQTLDDRKQAIKQVGELWTMKELGVTNSDAYQRKHGQPVPRGASSQ